MNRKPNRSSSNKRRRSRKKGIGQFVRGLILEGLGIATLVFLYFAIQTTSADQFTQTQDTKVEPTVVQTQPAPVINGHYASSWSRVHQEVEES